MRGDGNIDSAICGKKNNLCKKKQIQQTLNNQIKMIIWLFFII